jgi:hypothetical protein
MWLCNWLLPTLRRTKMDIAFVTVVVLAALIEWLLFQYSSMFYLGNNMTCISRINIVALAFSCKRSSLIRNVGAQ